MSELDLLHAGALVLGELYALLPRGTSRGRELVAPAELEVDQVEDGDVDVEDEDELEDEELFDQVLELEHARAILEELERADAGDVAGGKE